MMEKFLIIGLGNPGKEYEFTRHNAGFILIDRIQQENEFNSWLENKKYNGEISFGFIGNIEIILLKPMTFMNLSGICISGIANFYKIPSKNLIVIHDDIDLEIGKIKFSRGNSHGGHNGLKSINQFLKNDYLKIRIGIGRDSKMNAASFVLSKFFEEELKIIDNLSIKISKSMKEIILANDKEIQDISSKLNN